MTRGLKRKFKIKGMMAFLPGASTNYIFFTKKCSLLTSGLEDKEVEG